MTGMASPQKQRIFNNEPGIHNKNRLIQAWVILVGMARNRQTITYAELAHRMLGENAQAIGKRAGQWRGLQLGQLLTYCKARKLPLLPAIVVMKKTGLPADTAPYEGKDLNAERETVFNFDWYALYPPNDSELASVLISES